MWWAGTALSNAQHHPLADSSSLVTLAPQHNRPIKSWLDRNIDDPVALWTLVLALFTGTLAIVSMRQFKYIRRADQTARIAANAARVTAEATSKQADVVIAVERPIFIIEDVLVKKGSPIYSIRFGNHGRTLAIVTETCLALQTGRALLPDPTYPPYSIKRVDQDRVVEPQNIYEMQERNGLPDEDWDRVLRGETVLWAYGYIDYLDFLKEERREGFCIGFRPERSPVYSTSTPSRVIWSRVGPPLYTLTD